LNTAQPIVTILDDIIGLERNILTPSMGAYEHSVDYNPPVVPIPQNLHITRSGSQAQLDWDEVPEASSYNVFVASAPDAIAWNLAGSTIAHSFTITNLTAGRNFYKVTAVVVAK
jgi:hypothetical protein